MLYALVGTDTEARRTSQADILARHADREALYFDSESFDEGLFMNAIAGPDMFGGGYIAVIRDIAAGDKGDFVTSRLAEMAASDTVFVLSEESVPKALAEELKEHAESYKIVDLPKNTNRGFNMFSITDAFGARDKKSVWVLLQEALQSGVAPEEVLNILIWQAKNLLITKNAASAAETGLAPFVFQKSKGYSKNFEVEELKTISRKLTSMFHESHLGMDLGPNLELFLLKTL